MDTTKTFRDKMIDFYHQVKIPIDFISREFQTQLSHSKQES